MSLVLALGVAGCESVTPPDRATHAVLWVTVETAAGEAVEGAQVEATVVSTAFGSTALGGCRGTAAGVKHGFTDPAGRVLLSFISARESTECVWLTAAPPSTLLAGPGSATIPELSFRFTAAGLDTLDVSIVLQPTGS